MTAKDTQTPPKRIITARVPADLVAELGRMAEAGDRSVAAELRRAVRLHVNRRERA